ncbi:MAG: NAD(P)/FAD-dependent oxidoreductase [Elusimicrobiales bacterium]
MSEKTVVIIGAGPSGLTAGYELLKKSGFKAIIIEKLNIFGGIARTISYKGNRMDLGGHRFFTKSENVKKIWEELLPIQSKPSKDDILTERYKEINYPFEGPDPEKEDKVMLIRKRTSRIYYLKKFFDYPVSLNKNTIKNLGFLKMSKIGISYLKSQIFPIKPEKSLEDFFINRFGYELYDTFFRDYTEKVWGTKCSEIKPEWGEQRIKGLSIKSILKDIILNSLSKNYSDNKKIETTLIRKFYYPKYGPGQLWDEMADIIEKKGGIILKNTEVVRLETDGFKITKVIAKNLKNREKIEIKSDFVISSMAIKDLLNAMDRKEEKAKKVAENLVYRDFLTTGILVKKLKIKNETKEKTINDIIPDNWIYLQDRDMIAGRLQIFNNWSPYLVADLNTVWLGVEFFCNKNDNLWNMGDNELINLSVKELEKCGIIESSDFIDGTVERVEKAYPAYFGSYENFDVVKNYLDKIENLYPVGRNGMHRYNNMDHSMLTAIEAVRCILEGRDKKDIWNINTEKEYHEDK